MHYREAVDWLFGVIRFGMKLGLDNTRALLAYYGLPHPGLRIIHVAGTNGKGSTCAFAHACLHAAGTRAGLFTSPHLIDFRERVRVGNDLISESDAARLLTELRQRTESMDPHPSFFEVAFVLALLHFREAKAECAVIETGLGGRLDATNVLTPDVSVITRIGLDHQKWLGNSFAEIAAEKAGIIKPGIPVVTAPQESSALTIIKNRAAEFASPLTIVDPDDYPPGCSLGLKGAHQRENAALALAAIDALKRPDVDPAARDRGLAEITWPARFQILTPSEFPAPVVIDGAHNPDAARVLKATWRSEFPGQKATVIYSAAGGKDVPQFITEILNITARLVLTKSSVSRARPPEDLREEITAALPVLPELSLAPDPAAALARAKSLSEPTLVTGSLFLAGDVLALLQNSPSPDPSEKL